MLIVSETQITQNDVLSNLVTDFGRWGGVLWVRVNLLELNRKYRDTLSTPQANSVSTETYHPIKFEVLTPYFVMSFTSLDPL
jgi:hypothetical protein